MPRFGLPGKDGFCQSGCLLFSHKKGTETPPRAHPAASTALPVPHMAHTANIVVGNQRDPCWKLSTSGGWWWSLKLGGFKEKWYLINSLFVTLTIVQKASVLAKSILFWTGKKLIFPRKKKVRCQGNQFTQIRAFNFNSNQGNQFTQIRAFNFHSNHTFVHVCAF